MKSAILVDEMNVMAQLHRIGVQGINPWVAFFKALEKYIEIPTEFHLYGANVPKEILPERYQKRLGFFRALERDNIHVHQGFTVLDRHEQLVEKGVDVLLSLDLSAFALEGYKDIIVCSGDGDLVPAIERAQFYGSRIHVVVSDNIPAKYITDVADIVIRLEDVLSWIPPKHIIRRNLKTKLKEESVA